MDRKILFAIASILFAINSNLSALNISLVELAKYFGTSIADISFVYAGFIMFFAGFVLVAGRLCDIYSHAKIFRYGLLVFVISSLIGGGANFPLQVKIATCLQGFGCALLYPSSTAILFSMYPKDSKASPMALIATVGGVANALTPIVIGYLITFISWRMVFLLNLIPLFITYLFMKNKTDTGDVKSAYDLDVLSVVLLVLMFFCSYYLLDVTATYKSYEQQTQMILTATILLLITLPAFIIRSKKSKNPFIDFNIFKNYSFTTAVISRFITMGTYIAALFLITTIIQMEYKYNAFATGLILSPAMIALTIFSMISGKLANKGLLKRTLLLGLIIIAIGTVILYAQTSNLYTLVCASVVMAIGHALSTPPLSTVAITSVDDVHKGVASGVVFTVIMFGALFGLILGNFIINTKPHSELVRYDYGIALSQLSMIITMLIAFAMYISIRFIKYE